ncbi:MAG: hypothetical protein EXR77_06930 [Myxococcales bacterium]|nr:hypothetical protein [Myxococcales bacterium]
MANDKRKEIHEKALRAAMAVAFGAACSTPTAPSTSLSTAAAAATDSSLVADSAADSAAGVDTAGKAAAADAPAGDAVAADGANSDAAVADAADSQLLDAPASTDVQDSATADAGVDGLTEIVVDPVTGKPDCTKAIGVNWQPCCDELAQWCKAKIKDEAKVNECLFGPNFDGSTGCVPWGPPAPPAMPIDRVVVA